MAPLFLYFLCRHIKATCILVCSVSFLKADKTKFPGGAWRAECSVDGQIDLPFEQISELLDLEQSTFSK